MILEILIGKTLVNIETTYDEVILTTEDGKKYRMFHYQDCCESVYLEDIVGDINDLIGSPLLMAEEVTESGDGDYGSYTWTFYKFATVKGYVTLRWYGSSNGYYSESVSFDEIEE